MISFSPTENHEKIEENKPKEREFCSVQSDPPENCHLTVKKLPKT